MAQLVEACARLEPQYLEQRDQVICEPEVVTFGVSPEIAERLRAELNSQ